MKKMRYGMVFCLLALTLSGCWKKKTEGDTPSTTETTSEAKNVAEMDNKPMEVAALDKAPNLESSEASKDDEALRNELEGKAEDFGREEKDPKGGEDKSEEKESEENNSMASRNHDGKHMASHTEHGGGHMADAHHGNKHQKHPKGSHEKRDGDRSEEGEEGGKGHMAALNNPAFINEDVLNG